MVNVKLEDLAVYYNKHISKPAISGINLDIKQGSKIAFVGETGSGKSTTALVIAGLMPKGSHFTGAARVASTDLSPGNVAELRQHRIQNIGYIPQNAQSALNPVRTIWFSFKERARGQNDTAKKLVLDKSKKLLMEVGFSDPERILRSYPHQLSGGMRQRVLIAIALYGSPKIVVADEPTSGLDVSVQAGILKLIKRLDMDQTLILITHDLSVASILCNTICVMYRGKVVEVDSSDSILNSPEHPYTAQLVAAARGVTNEH